MRRRHRNSSNKTAVEDDFRESAVKYVVETTIIQRQKAKQKTLLTSIAAISALIIVAPFLPKLLVATSEQITEFFPASDTSTPAETGEFFTQDGQPINPKENLCDPQSSTEECEKPQGLMEKIETFKKNTRENQEKLKQAIDQS